MYWIVYIVFLIYVIVLYLKILYWYYIWKIYTYFYGENNIYYCIKDLIELFFFIYI